MRSIRASSGTFQNISTSPALHATCMPGSKVIRLRFTAKTKAEIRVDIRFRTSANCRIDSQMYCDTWGLKKVTGVGIILPQRAETVIGHMAIYKLGAIALPLSVLFGPEAVGYRLNNSGTKVVITDTEHVELLESIRDELPQLENIIDCDSESGFWELIDQASDSFEIVNTLAEDPAYLVYTSGTTGPPKGALAPHRCLIGNLTGFEMSHNFFPQKDDLFWTPGRLGMDGRVA